MRSNEISHGKDLPFRAFGWFLDLPSPNSGLPLLMIE